MKQIVVHVYKYNGVDGTQKFSASIGNGWWFATSNDPNAAVKAAIKRYENETGKKVTSSK